MAIKCKKCGAENPLGRIFCGQCGDKLDLSLSSADIEQLEKPAWIRTAAMYAGVVLAAMLVLGGVLAFWAEKPYATGGKQSDSRKVMQRLNGIDQMLAAGSGGSVEFSQDELNGYLFHYKRDAMKVESISACLRPDEFALRVVRKFRPIKIGSRQSNPKMSFDLVVSPDGNERKIKRAKIGRLPLLGPLASPVARAITGSFEEDKDQALFDERTSLIAEEGRLIIEVRPQDRAK